MWSKWYDVMLRDQVYTSHNLTLHVGWKHWNHTTPRGGHGAVSI